MTRMMHVYFVRHGETPLNRQHLHQTPITPLSNLGCVQARTVAEYLRPMNIDCVVSSDYTRALQTARIVGATLNVTVRAEKLFREIERPSVLGGTSIFSIRTMRYIVSSILHRNNPSWRYRDAENFTDIFNRTKKSLAFLESLGNEYQSVVVVSHTIYINLIVAYMCHDRFFALRDLLPVLFNMKHTHNGGVIGVVYNPNAEEGTCAWQHIMEDGSVGIRYN